MDDDVLDFNFWPSFADLMLSIVLVLVLVIALVAGVLSIGNENLKQVKKNQENMVNTIASAYKTSPKKHSEREDVFHISTTNSSVYDIEIRNEPALQRITFSDQILFMPDDYQLNKKGQEVLTVVGGALKQQLSIIRELQIQGHADTDATSRHTSNVHLAAFRSIEVYKFFQNSTGIDPAANLMSTTSFGEFKPVQRADDRQYNKEELKEHNSNPKLKADNRRIELLLFYRL